MALSQADRIAISKKIVGIPLQNEAADKTKAELAKAKVEFTQQDQANRSIIEDKNVLINAYQAEISRYDGNARTTLVEQDFIDSVNRKKNNPFFPNDNNLPLPNIPDGIWIHFIPFANTKAVGRRFDETYNSTTKEQDLIDAVLAAIATVNAFSDITQTTGQECNAGGSCSLPQYDNQTDCTNNGGTWTTGPDQITTSTAMHDAGDALVAAIQAWEDFMNVTHAVIPSSDTDATRSSQNDAARSDITNAISVIDAWQALPDYDTSHGQTTCMGFNSYDPFLLDQTKFRPDSIQTLSDELTARQSFITTRVSQISGHLGGVSQDYSTGSLNSTSGFYGSRFRFIDLRLNAVAGSLTRLKGLERGEEAQEKFKESNDNATAAYDDLMKAVAFRSPGTNTKSIHVMSASDFSVGDSVYVVSDTQSEISATIELIDGNRVVLSTSVPEKYRHTQFARLYKVL